MPVVTLSTANWGAIGWGFGISLLVGFVLAGSVVAITRWDAHQFYKGFWPGLVERTFFTTLVFFNFPSIPIAMVAFIGAKMAAGWNMKGLDDGETPESGKTDRFAALLGGLMSMLCAAIGGLIANGQLKW